MKKAKPIFLLLIILLAWLYLYTFLHEGGHALIALIYGGHIEKIVLGLSAHVIYNGVELNSASEALLNINGLLLPIVVSFAALLFYRNKVANLWYHICYAIMTISIVSTCVPWVVLPLLSFFCKLPEGDDITQFLNNSDINPLILVFGVILIIVLLLFTANKKGLFQRLKIIFEEVKIKGKRTLSWKDYFIRFLSLLFLLAAFFLLGNRITNSSPILILDSTYSMMITKASEPITLPFDASTKKEYLMSLELKADKFLTDIRITDENDRLIYQNMSQYFDLETKINLRQGHYVMTLNFLTTPEELQTYIHSMKYTFDRNSIEQMIKESSLDYDFKTYPMEFSVMIK